LLDAVIEGADGGRIACFLHRPLFLDSPSEDDTGYWSVKPQPRARLLELVQRHSVAPVANGHLHKAHQMRHQGTPGVGRTRNVDAPTSLAGQFEQPYGLV
jgi:hypothetical protein